MKHYRLTVAALATTILVSSMTGANAAVPSSSITISPDLAIPDESEWKVEAPTREDVIRTMNMNEIELMTTAALAETSMSVEQLLGYSEQELNSAQVKMFTQSVADYSKRITLVSNNATDASEIEEVLKEFQEWTNTFSNAVLKQRELDIEARKLEQKEKEERLAKIKAEEEAATEEVTEVTEVTSEDKEEDLTPSPDIESAHISYGIPELGRQYLTYMPHRTITSKSSRQWKLQQIAETDEEGYRTVKGMPLIALASSYGTKIGTVYDITFANGDVLRAVLGDCKDDRHTDSRKQYRDSSGVYDGSSGNILEMILDDSKFSSMNAANRKINGDYPTKIVSIVKVGEVEGF